MIENKDREQGIGDATAHDSEKESKSKAKRAAISRRALCDGIIHFLEGCTEGEADAVCAIARFASSKDNGDTISIPASDKRVINTFLNAGYSHYAEYAKADEVREHRLQRAKALRSKVKMFFSNDQYDKVSDTLVDLALDKEDVDAFVKVRKSMTTSHGPGANIGTNTGTNIGANIGANTSTTRV